MLSLIIWMHLNEGNMMTVQLTAPMSCGPLREAMAAQPEVEHAMCAGDPKTVERYIKEGDCTVIEVRDDFVSYVCKKPAPTFPPRRDIAW